ncbi:MAG: response regulator, partial [Fulvivirga sp.]|nr:response regulator [Fulvivirga sp.]
MVKLLLVEDDQNLGMVISDNLQVEGYQVTWAKDGAEALDVFSQKDFDICLLDVMLPKKDGFAVAGEIRKSDHMVPILFLTAKSMEEDRL